MENKKQLLIAVIIVFTNLIWAQNIKFYEGTFFTGSPFIYSDQNDLTINPTDFFLNNAISSIKIDDPYGKKLQLHDGAAGSGDYINLKFTCDNLSKLNMNDKISTIKIKQITPYALAYKSRNDSEATMDIDADPNGYHLIDNMDNVLTYFAVQNGYVAILYENADAAHDKLHKGFGKTFVIYGQGLGNDKKQVVGPLLRNKVSYVKVVPEGKLLESI